MRTCKVCSNEFEGQRCKICHKRMTASWHERNKERSKIKRHEWYENNKEYKLAKNKEWQISHKEQIAKNYAELYIKNREKYKTKQREYANKNKDKIKEYKNKWRKENPNNDRLYRINRLSRKNNNGGILSKGLVEKLYELQKGRCACCGKKLGNDYHLDHIMPLALGGLNEDSNMQLLKSKCNLQKHAKHPIDFMQERGYLI